MPVIRFDDTMSRTLFWVIAAAVLVMGSLIIAPFIPSIMWAAVLSVLTYPYFKRLINKGWNETGAAAWVTLVTTLLIVLPILGFATAAVMEGAKAFSSANGSAAPDGGFTIASVAAEIDRQATPLLSGLPIPALSEFRLEKFITENQDDIREAVVGPATRGLVKFGTAVFSALVAVLTFFFFLKDGRKLLEPALLLIPLPRSESLAILNRLRETVFSVFMGVVFVALIQGAVAGLAYAVCGVPGVLIWTMATFVFAMIPLVGPPVVFVPIAISLFLAGKPGHAIGLLLFGALVITQIDNILRPFFIGARASLHPLAVFFSLLGGVLMMGPIGLMAGPIILTLCIVVSEVLMARRKMILPEEPSEEPAPSAA
jgi:predicted PurR-regulated permease PerM